MVYSFITYFHGDFFAFIFMRIRRNLCCCFTHLHLDYFVSTITIFSVQQACGFEYTSKLQRMFQDIGVSKDLNEQFKKHLSNSEPLDCKTRTAFLVSYATHVCVEKDWHIFSYTSWFFICLPFFSFSVDFSIQVLSSGSWPFQQSCTFALPSEVRLCTILIQEIDTIPKPHWF